MKYINLSHTTKTFYGVEFKPGDVKDVPGFINADGMYRTEINEPVKGKKSDTAEQVETVDTTEAASKEEETTTPKKSTRKTKGVID